MFCVVHGDDFVFEGLDANLKWVQARMEEKFLTKVVGKLGGDQGDLREIRIPNRILRWTEHGILYEADPRHSEILVKALGRGTRSVTTLGAKRAPTADSLVGGDCDETPLSEE